MTSILTTARELDVAWYGAAAGAAAAGAALVPSNRIGAGAFGALVVLALGVWRAHAKPCCAGCAGEGAAAALASPPAAAPAVAVDFARLMNGAGIVPAGGCS